MISLRNFEPDDAIELQQKQSANMPLDQVMTMIAEWQKKEISGKYFEAFAVVRDSEIVGMMLLCQHSENIISCGPEIFEAYRKQGIAAEAMALVMKTAKEKGYRLMSQQIRMNNTASIALHNKLGFETDGYTYKNKHGNDVQIFIKLL